LFKQPGLEPESPIMPSSDFELSASDDDDEGGAAPGAQPNRPRDMFDD